MVTKEWENQLQATQRKMVRWMLNRPWPPRRQENEGCEAYVKFLKETAQEIDELIAQGSLEDWSVKQRYLQWKWAGEIARQADGRWSSAILHWNPQWDGAKLDLRAGRDRGRQFKRWRDELDAVCDGDWIKSAQDETKWRDVHAQLEMRIRSAPE